jgi:hypothetical protein
MKLRQLIVVVTAMLAIIVVMLFDRVPESWQVVDNESVATAQTLDSSEEPAASSEEPAASSEEPVANCRYGLTSLNPRDTQGVAWVGAGWYLNFTPYPESRTPSNGAEFTPLIAVNQRRDSEGQPIWISYPKLDQAFEDYIIANPGLIFLVGNEIDRVGQGGITAELYVQAYHDIYHFIKKADPTAQVAISGLVQVTPMRIQYLDKVWDAYYDEYGVAIPVDVWNMHIYPLSEVKETEEGFEPSRAGIALGTDPNLGKRESDLSAEQCTDPSDNIYCISEIDNMQIFKEQVTMMRQWMKDHGQQNKPLILSEFSILWPYVVDDEGCFIQDEHGNCFDPERVMYFMRLSFQFMRETKDPDLGYPADNNRLVQRWMWFATWNAPGKTGQASNILADDRQSLTEVGRAFHKWIHHNENPRQYVNLFAEDAATVTVQKPDTGDAAAKISVTFRNNGNDRINKPFDVAFYRNSTLTQRLGTVRIDPGVNGCATMPISASIDWKGLDEGRHYYWAVVDDKNEIVEIPGDNADNVARGVVLVYDEQIQLPTIFSN